MPAALNLAILRCLRVAPEHRFQTVDELLLALPEGCSERASEAVRDMVYSRPPRSSAVVQGTQTAPSMQSRDGTLPVPGDTQAATYALDAGDDLSDERYPVPVIANEAPVIVYPGLSVKKWRLPCAWATATGTKMVQCDNGHFYNTRRHTHCPYCPVPGLRDVRIPGTASIPLRELSRDSVDDEASWPCDISRIVVFSEASDVQAGSVLSLDTKEPSREQHLLIKGISARIGRSSDNEIRIEDDLVPRYLAMDCGLFVLRIR